MTWRWVDGLAKLHVNLYVITEGEWKEEIDNAVGKSEYRDYMHFYYNPVSERIRKMCWNQGDYRFYYYYRKWQKKTHEIAKTIISEHHIDIIHHLNMIGFREPGDLWKIEGIPYVWGPIGGMSYVPLNYLKESSLKTLGKCLFKNLVSKLQFRYSSRVKRAFGRSDVLICANQNSYKIIKKFYPQKQVVLINETGCSDEGPTKLIEDQKDSFDVLWVGRFIPTKMLDLTLTVIRELADLPNLKVHIVGESKNPEITAFYKEKARKLGIENLCDWRGWISHDEVQALMKESDLLFFPSVVEGTPHVVLESIANNLPIVCFDACGQGDIVNERLGIKIPVSRPEESICKFVEAISELYHDRKLLSEMRANCNDGKKELSWNRKIEQVYSIYKSCLGNGNTE
jgi:glycosyltransferase involved in cell wall biosynthesis